MHGFQQLPPRKRVVVGGGLWQSEATRWQVSRFREARKQSKKVGPCGPLSVDLCGSWESAAEEGPA